MFDIDEATWVVLRLRPVPHISKLLESPVYERHLTTKGRGLLNHTFAEDSPPPPDRGRPRSGMCRR